MGQKKPGAYLGVMQWVVAAVTAVVAVVFESPVPRLEKDQDWTGPRLEKTGPAVQVFDF